jgi:uncharacterized DUF497 family protein
VTFEQATGVFNDPVALTVYDNKESSEDEDRWITLGQANGQHYLVVVHTHRPHQQDSGAVTIRLISVRPATKHEIKQYEGDDYA